MREILSVTMVLFLMVSSGMAERKPLDKKHREIKPGASEVLVPNPKRQDGYDLIIKNHEVKYDEKTGFIPIDIGRPIARMSICYMNLPIDSM